MTRYPRLPAAIVLLAAAVCCGVYVRTAISRNNGNGMSLHELEAAIAAGKADAAIWQAYGQRCAEAKRFREAAAAFRRVMELAPSREATVACAAALARTSGDELYEFLKELVNTDPKLVVELLERPEMQPHLRETRFDVLQKDARAQAMD